MARKDHLITLQEDSKLSKKFLTRNNVIAFQAQQPTIAQQINAIGATSKTPDEVKDTKFPVLNPIDAIGKNISAALDIDLSLENSPFHCLELSDVGDTITDLAIDFINLVKNKAEHFILDITKDPGNVSTPTITFTPTVENLPAGFPSDDPRYLLEIVARETPTETRFEVISGGTVNAANKTLSNLVSPTAINQDLLFSAATFDIANTTNPVNNLFVKQLRLQNGTLVINVPNIVSEDGNQMTFNVDTAQIFLWKIASITKMTVAASSLNLNSVMNLSNAAGITLSNAGFDPVANGEFRLNATDVKVFSGGAVRNLSDIGTGGSQTPWVADIDADGFDLKDLSNIEFRVTTGSPAGSVPSIWVDPSGDMVLNAAINDQFFLTVDGTTALQVQDGETEIRSTFGTATTGPQLSIFNNDSGIVVNDRVGLVSFRALNSTPSETQFGAIEVQAEDLTAGTEDATMILSVMSAGSQAPFMVLDGIGDNVVISAGATRLRPSDNGGKELGGSSNHWDDVFSETFTLRGSGGNTTGSARTIYADATKMVLNMPAGDEFHFAINGVSKIKIRDTGRIFELEANGTSAPVMFFDYQDPSPANLKTISSIFFDGQNSTSTSKTFATINTGQENITAGAEDGFLVFKVISAGVGGVQGFKIVGDTTTKPKIGFFNATPVSQSPPYTVTNLTTDRSYDADATSLAEIADVLGTLLSDLVKLGVVG